MSDNTNFMNRIRDTLWGRSEVKIQKRVSHFRKNIYASTIARVESALHITYPLMFLHYIIWWSRLHRFDQDTCTSSTTTPWYGVEVQILRQPSHRIHSRPSERKQQYVIDDHTDRISIHAFCSTPVIIFPQIPIIPLQIHIQRSTVEYIGFHLSCWEARGRVLQWSERLAWRGSHSLRNSSCVARLQKQLW